MPKSIYKTIRLTPETLAMIEFMRMSEKRTFSGWMDSMLEGKKDAFNQGFEKELKHLGYKSIGDVPKNRYKELWDKIMEGISKKYESKCKIDPFSKEQPVNPFGK